MPLVDSGQPHIHYQLRGQQNAPVLIMLRGLGRSLLYWEELLLEQLEPHFYLLLIDNRGVGKSKAPRYPFTIASMSDDVARVLDHAGFARAHLFGMSLGGMIAQRFAIDHGGRLDRLVLGCTTPGGKSPRPPLTLLWPTLKARLQGPAETCRFEAEQVLSAQFRRERPEVVAHWASLAQRYPLPRSTIPLQLLAAFLHDTNKELDRITAPTLVVSSSSDALIPPENSHLLARGIFGAELVWLDGAGHDFATEQPDETARLLLDFLQAPKKTSHDAVASA